MNHLTSNLYKLWPVLLRHRQQITTIQHATKFFEADKRGGYDTKLEKPIGLAIKDGLGELKTETGKLKEEIKHKFISEPYWFLQHDDYEVVFRLNDNKSINEWVVSCDQDHGEGKSQAEFYLGPQKRGIFKGVINTEVPKDGVTKSAGYANMKSPKSMKSFKRDKPMDWEMYTHLMMMVRGDGRPYQVVIGMDRYYDVQWHDQYSFPLFTRGGPYWQFVKIPFSKFFLNAKGRIQDKQSKIQLDRVSWVGITLSDGYNGPFELEIDWIGVVYDENHNEDFEYEMYKVRAGEVE